MKNKLSQEYKDDLYEKVLEKKRQRTVRRKKMLSIFIVFVSVVGFTTLGFSLLGQDDYCNFFTSETENIMIEDEYQYFDDLGIKLEFINIDDNSLTLGINIKYEDIAEYEVNFGEIVVSDKNEEILLHDNSFEYKKMYNIKDKTRSFIKKDRNEVVYIIKFLNEEKIIERDVNIRINNLIVSKEFNELIKFEYKKEISIED